MKNTKSIILFFFVLLPISIQALIKPGTKAPHFKVMDGNEKWLDKNSLKGKLIVGFYQDRESAEKNRSFRDELNKFYDESESIVNNIVIRLAVVDAMPANFATAWIWRMKFRSKSTELGITVYGDWDGAMKSAYGFPDKESTFFIIDKKGIIQYIYSGKIPVREYTSIKSLIARLTIEK